MREIKFRAWHKTWSALPVDKSDWHRPNQKINGMQFVRGLWTSTHGRLHVELEDWKSGVLDDQVELMQFTGLTDKNGKEIYEGDILGTDIGNVVVRWERQGWLPWIAPKGTQFEVIGNIYENPELLQTETLADTIADVARELLP